MTVRVDLIHSQVFHAALDITLGSEICDSMTDPYQVLVQRFAEIKAKLTLAEEEIAGLRSAFVAHTQTESVFDKAFRAGGLWGDFLEFGVFRGGTFANAYAAALRIYTEMVSDRWSHSRSEQESSIEHFHRAWSEIRFIGFDSFEGLPEPRGVDAELKVFEQGTYACSEEDFLCNIESKGVDLAKVRTVKGFYEETLNSKTAQNLLLRRVAVVHIDSDLYESAKNALNFVTPFLIDGAIVIFDEWYQYMSSPYRGERRAFLEWCGAHPEWIVSGFHKEGAFGRSFVLSRRLEEDIAEQPSALYA